MTMLDKAVEREQEKGYCIFRYVDGQYTMWPNSNLYHCVQDCKKEYPGCEITVAVGARRRYRTMGFKMCVLFKI